MKKLTTLLIMLLLMGANHLIAQDNLGIEGKILDDKNQQPVAFANVAVYNQLDSSLVKGAITNDKGEFDISGLRPNDYYLKVSYIGYQNKTVNKVSLSNAPDKVNVGTIGISAADTELGEVTVKEDKLKGQEKVDRTVYNVTDKIHEVSSNGLDVLKYIPSVSVDFQDNVTLEGRSDILFFVDDIQRDKDFVAQLDPSTIDRVETMTNPSAKYDADVSGIIHIYLKKEKRFGLSGIIGADIPSPPNYIMNPSASLDYGYSNVRIYVANRMHFEKFTGYQETNTIKTINNTIDQQVKRGDGDFSWLNNNLNYGIDWFINDKNSLNFLGNYSIHQALYTDFQFDSRHLFNDVLIGRELIDQGIDEKGNSNYFSLYYKRKFDNPDKELTAQAAYYDYSGRNNNEFRHHILDVVSGDILDEYLRKEIINNHRNTAKFELDYTQNFTKSKLELGSKTYYQWYDNQQKGASDAIENTFLFNEIRQSAYANYSYKFDKLTIQAGLRTEYSKSDFDKKSDNEYICWLPNLSFMKQLEKSQSLKLNLRRRIYRPGIDELNPFEIWYDSLHVTKGNPDLQPSYSNDIELVYSKNFESNMISPKLFAKYMTNDFQQVSFINSDNVTETVVDNIGKSWEFGLSLTYAFKLAKWWRLTGFASVSNTIIYSDNSFSALPEETQEKVSYKTNVNSIMTFFKSWNFMMMVNYRSPYISYQKTTSRDLLWIVAVEKEIFKNGKLQLFYLPPYTKEFTFSKNETKTPELYDSWKGAIKADYLFAIEFNYTFSSGKKVKKLNRATEIESDGNNSLF